MSTSRSQLIVHGRVRGALGSGNFREARGALLAEVLASYRRLQAACDLVVVEGAGSPAEINLRAGDIAPRAIVVAPLLASKREWCKTSREAATTLKIIDAYFAEEARGALATVDRSRVYVTGPSCGGLGAYTLAARLARRGDGFSDRCPPAAAVPC